ncbi:unnamed protein product [Rhizophagus irregularis]|nr:unnamed protein product [Rhizophagus irregularis]
MNDIKQRIITERTLYNRNFQMPVIELWRINFSLVSVNEEIINNCANINVNIQDTLGGTELSELAMNSEYGASTCPCETCET